MNAEFVEPHRPTRVMALVAMGALGLGVLLAGVLMLLAVGFIGVWQMVSRVALELDLLR